MAVILKPSNPKDRLVGLAYSTWFQDANWQNVWGTPELGYYRSDDRRVIRQHAEWIADAGVDYVWVDWSNDVLYTPGVTKGRTDFEMIENSVKVMFEEYSQMKKHPKISIFIGCPDWPKAVDDGKLTAKADQVYEWFCKDPKYRKIMQDYLGKPLLVVYVNTPTPWQTGIPKWNHPKFTVRWMTGFITQQPYLMDETKTISRYGYWSWEDRGPQTVAPYRGTAEAMVCVACYRKEYDDSVLSPGRRNGQTFREQWARVRKVGPRICNVVSFNEWTKGEQPSAEGSKDVEPSKEFGHLYMSILKDEIAKFKRGI